MRNGSESSTKAGCDIVPLNATESLLCHWQQYLMEACELGLYMFSICALATLLQHPASPVRQFVPSAIGRRALMGSAVGLTVVGIILTPWGKQSGGHFNPAITNELRSHIKQCVPKRHLTKPIEGQGLDQG